MQVLPVKKRPAEHAFSAVSGKMKEEEKKKKQKGNLERGRTCCRQYYYGRYDRT